jgi:hypothetical protein
MTDRKLYRHESEPPLLVSGLLIAVLLATGLTAIALAAWTSAKPQARSITASVQLRHSHVQTGGTVRGEVVFQNRTSTTRVLLRGCKIDGLYAIGFRASNGYVQAPAFSLVGCSPEQELVAKPGTTVYRFETSATYAECSQSAKGQPPRYSKYWSPLCLRDSRGQRDIIPPLPEGNYSALFFPAGQWHGPPVKPARLLVTRR